MAMIDSSDSDAVWMRRIGKYVQSNRLNLNRTQAQVAVDAGISRSTLSLLEGGENIQLDSLIRVLRVLDLLEVLAVFEEVDEISPIEYAKLKRKNRKQASPQKHRTKFENQAEW